MVVGDFFKGVIKGVGEEGSLISEMTHHYHHDGHGIFAFILHGLTATPFMLAMGGLASAWFIYMKKPDIAEWFYNRFRWLHTLLDNKYYIDDFNQKVFAGGAVGLGKVLWNAGDRFLIDDGIVNDSAGFVKKLSDWSRYLQTGYMYHYAFSMIIGVLGLIGWIIYTAG
jgi:NADH-quinone oxidoreductase subunit L